MIAAALLIAAAAAVPPTGACTLCHPEVRVRFEASAHMREGIICISCHGGDATATTVEGAHRGKFIGIPKRSEIPSFCASCHSDIEQMRGYNLPTDQLALYQTSGHGTLLANGDDRVAVCTDCHGTHEIRSRDDPRSSVFPANIPATCEQCHADGGRGDPDGLAIDVLTEYTEGVHGRAFFQEPGSGTPQCASCHSAHGAAPPGVGNVDKVCGQCHTTTRAYFIAGPHKKGMDEAGLPECASCHGNHRILAADVSMLDGICLQCHEEGSGQQEMAVTMKSLYIVASEEIDRANSMVERAATIPLYVEDYRARLEEGRTALVESLPVMHSLDVDHVENLTRRARSIASEVESEIGGKLEGRRWRRVGLMLFWFYLILTIAILTRYRSRAALEASR